jgi:hypothetical protein
VFDHLRADREAAKGALIGQVTDVTTQRGQAQDQVVALAGRVPAFEAALAQAVAMAGGPNSALADAQAVVGQRAAERDSRQSHRDAATEAVRQHEQDEPPDGPDPNGKPNQEHRAWAQELGRLRKAVTTSIARLHEAQAQLDAAVAVRDARAQDAASAAAVVAQAQSRLDAARQDVGRAAQIVEGLDRVVAVLQQQVGAADTGIAALDARAARLVADPLDRADLQVAADAELAAALDYRRQRFGLLQRRAAARAARAAQLAAADATADSLAGLPAEILGWPDLGRFAELSTVAAVLADLVATSRARRSIPPDGRDDDLAAVTARLAGLARLLAGVVGRAASERDAAQKRVDDLGAQLRAHQLAVP